MRTTRNCCGTGASDAVTDVLWVVTLFTDTRMAVRKANWIGDVVHRNCHLRHVIEGNIEVIGRLRGRRKQLLDDVKEKRRHWKLKEEALDVTLVRNRCGRIKIKKEAACHN
jgi:hypothetical protein